MSDSGLQSTNFHSRSSLEVSETAECLRVIKELTGVEFSDIGLRQCLPVHPTNEAVFALLKLNQGDTFMTRFDVLVLMGYDSAHLHEAVLPLSLFRRIVVNAKMERGRCEGDVELLRAFHKSRFGVKFCSEMGEVNPIPPLGKNARERLSTAASRFSVPGPSSGCVPTVDATKDERAPTSRTYSLEGDSKTENIRVPHNCLIDFADIRLVVDRRYRSFYLASQHLLVDEDSKEYIPKVEKTRGALSKGAIVPTNGVVFSLLGVVMGDLKRCRDAVAQCAHGTYCRALFRETLLPLEKFYSLLRNTAARYYEIRRKGGADEFMNRPFIFARTTGAVSDTVEEERFAEKNFEGETTLNCRVGENGKIVEKERRKNRISTATWRREPTMEQPGPSCVDEEILVDVPEGGLVRAEDLLEDSAQWEEHPEGNITNGIRTSTVFSAGGLSLDEMKRHTDVLSRAGIDYRNIGRWYDGNGVPITNEIFFAIYALAGENLEQCRVLLLLLLGYSFSSCRDQSRLPLEVLEKEVDAAKNHRTSESVTPVRTQRFMKYMFGYNTCPLASVLPSRQITPLRRRRINLSHLNQDGTDNSPDDGSLHDGSGNLLIPLLDVRDKLKRAHQAALSYRLSALGDCTEERMGIVEKRARLLFEVEDLEAKIAHVNASETEIDGFGNEVKRRDSMVFLRDQSGRYREEVRKCLRELAELGLSQEDALRTMRSLGRLCGLIVFD